MLQSIRDRLTGILAFVVLGILVIIEMLADKVPAVNHINDAIQTFVRPAAGAIAFALAVGGRATPRIDPVACSGCGAICVARSSRRRRRKRWAGRSTTIRPAA